MKPFEIPKVLESIKNIYPTKEEILDAIKIGDKQTCFSLAGLWLSEGIPFCFKSQPALYEEVRIFLSKELKINSKEITIIGSGRQGFSLEPSENFGRPFGNYSDLDMSIISLSLFDKLKIDFEKWQNDYEKKNVLPRNKKEEIYWSENKRRVPFNLDRGFIDCYKIPTFLRYQKAQEVAEVAYRVGEKLKTTQEAPKVERVSIRVYRDWDAFLEQVSVNLLSLKNI